MRIVSGVAIQEIPPAEAHGARTWTQKYTATEATERFYAAKRERDRTAAREKRKAKRKRVAKAACSNCGSATGEIAVEVAPQSQPEQPQQPAPQREEPRPPDADTRACLARVTIPLKHNGCGRDFISTREGLDQPDRGCTVCFPPPED